MQAGRAFASNEGLINESQRIAERCAVACVSSVVTGHGTIYEWKCRNEVREIVKQVFQVDERGYISEIWYPISPQ